MLLEQLREAWRDDDTAVREGSADAERSAGALRIAEVVACALVSLASIPGLGGYSAAKAASYSITQALRAEFAPKEIAVHAALPGPIDTDMVRSMEMAKTTPLDVARAILDGVERGGSEIFPDVVSRNVFSVWQSGPVAAARQLAAMG